MRCNRFSVLFFLFTSFLFFISCGMETKTLGFESPLIRYEGRLLKRASSVRFDYPGTRVAVGVEGPARLFASLKPDAGYFALFVDGREVSTIDTHSDSQWAEGFFLADLDRGRHELELVLKSEGLFCRPEFRGFSLQGGEGAFFPLERRRRQIEFIGNSITCGYGVDAADQYCTFADSTSNFVRSYAFLTANAFDAGLTVVARSGIGVYRNYAGSAEGSLRPMPVVYRDELISEPGSVRSFPATEPDLVIINLGTNDLSTPGFRMDLLEPAYRIFLAEVRTHYPDAKVLLLTGCMLPKGAVLDEFKALLDTIAADYRRGGDGKVFRFDFEPEDGTMGYGADWHPSLLRQQKMAQELVPFVASLMGWDLYMN